MSQKVAMAADNAAGTLAAGLLLIDARRAVTFPAWFREPVTGSTGAFAATGRTQRRSRAGPMRGPGSFPARIR